MLYILCDPNFSQANVKTKHLLEEWILHQVNKGSDGFPLQVVQASSSLCNKVFMERGRGGCVMINMSADEMRAH